MLQQILCGNKYLRQLATGNILQVQANKLIFIIMSITVLMVFWQNPEYLFDCNFQEMAD